MPINVANSPVYTVNTQAVPAPIPQRPSQPERNPKQLSENTDDEALSPEETGLRQPQPSERKQTNVGNNIDIKI